MDIKKVKEDALKEIRDEAVGVAKKEIKAKIKELDSSLGKVLNLD